MTLRHLARRSCLAVAFIVLALAIGALGANWQPTLVAESSALPPVFAVGEFLTHGDSMEPLYEIKAVHGDWIRVVTWTRGKATDEPRWINATTGQSWLYSPKAK